MMSDDELAAIRQRAASAGNNYNPSVVARRIAREDVPALLDEIARLKADNDNLIGLVLCQPGTFEHPAVDEDDPNPTMWAAYDFDAEDTRIKVFDDRDTAVAYVRAKADRAAEVAPMIARQVAEAAKEWADAAKERDARLADAIEGGEPS